MGIDIRTIKCACGSELCKTGIRFDSSPAILIFQDRNSIDHTMKLSSENIDELISELKYYKKVVNRSKK